MAIILKVFFQIKNKMNLLMGEIDDIENFALKNKY